MARKNSRSDLITGAFALFVIACSVFVVLFLQAVGPRVEGARYTVVFEDVGGLGGNAPLIVAGQKVGKVEFIRTQPVTRSDQSRAVEVEVGIIVDERYASAVVIPIDSVATVQMGSLFGGSQLVLKLGTAKEIVQPGQRLPNMGRPPVSLNDIIDSAQVTIKKLQLGLDQLADVLADPRFSSNIKESMESLRSTLKTLDEGLKKMEPAFGKIGPTLDNANDLLTEMRTLIKDNNETITSAIKHMEGAAKGADELLNGDAKALVADLRKIADNLDKLAGNLNNVVLDNQGNIAVSMANIRESTESIRVFARRIERDPSLLIWGSDEPQADPNAPAPRKTSDVDEWSMRRSGRLPRRANE
ncbi:MAG TPA: MlaD family protein [Planctomycetota bacterium]|nr:MlaD family protein [Planctomycetota bacterium]